MHFSVEEEFRRVERTGLGALMVFSIEEEFRGVERTGFGALMAVRERVRMRAKTATMAMRELKWALRPHAQWKARW